MQLRGVASGKGAAARQAARARALLLSSVLFIVTTAAAAAAGTSDEVAIMRKLRQAAHDADPAWTAGFERWQPGNPAHPCSWQYVYCDDRQRVIRVHLWNNGKDSEEASIRATPAASAGASGSTGAAGLPLPGPLLPDLAQLAFLEDLDVQRYRLVLQGGIPTEWLQLGAFPRLKSLTISVLELGDTLPDVPPGALPLLEQLRLQFEAPLTLLPASWGSSPAVLPALQHLNLVVPASGQLPAIWNAGFRHLQHLLIQCSAAADTRQTAAVVGGTPFAAPQQQAQQPRQQQQGTHFASSNTSGSSSSRTSTLPSPAAAVAAAAAGQLAGEPPAATHLPPEWAASGAFPSLEMLAVSGCGLAAPIPQAWIDGGFPSLSDLGLAGEGVTGGLPAQIFRRHPMLRKLWLLGNLTGALPEEWGESEVNFLKLEGNQLTGPAFPPAWLRPGAMSHLRALDLDGNPGLSGSLPPALAWPNITSLRLAGTGLGGRIPAQWCEGPLAGVLAELRIDDTSVDPTLPPCAARSLPTLHLTMPSRPPPPPHLRHPLSAATASLAALLPLGVLVAAGALGRVLWQRKLRRQRHQGEAQRLLQMPCQPGSTGHTPAGTDASSVDGSQPAVRFSGLGSQTKRQRLAGMLCAELGAGPGSRRLSMLPLEALPAALAHGLGKPGGSDAAAQGGRQHLIEQELLQQQQQQQQQQRERGEAEPLLPAAKFPADAGQPASDAAAAATAAAAAAAARAAAATANRPGPAEAGAAGQAGNSSSSSSGACRQWRLDTLSLQLAPHEVEFATDASSELIVLGWGAGSVVYRGWLAGVEVAIKVVELLPGMDSQAVWGEVSLLRHCTHPHIVPLIGLALKGPLLLLAMRLMRGGSLHSALMDPAKRQLLRWEARGRHVAAHVGEALKHLHCKLRVMHSDLKSSNVLLSEDLQGYVADLGVSQVLASTARTAAGGTIMYAAPEQLLGRRCTLAADMYCFGLLLVELTTRELILKRGGWRLPQAPHDCPQGVVDLIEQCMSTDPSHRPTAAQALQQLQQLQQADPG